MSWLFSRPLRPAGDARVQGVVNKRDEKVVGSRGQERGGGGLALTAHPDWSWRSTAEGGSP